MIATIVLLAPIYLEHTIAHVTVDGLVQAGIVQVPRKKLLHNVKSEKSALASLVRFTTPLTCALLYSGHSNQVGRYKLHLV